MRLIYLCLASLIWMIPSSASAKNIDTSLEESLALRRISEYWKERDYKAAKLQIEIFLGKTPETQYADRLFAMLGDLYFQERNYPEALDAYSKIKGQEFRLKSLFHRLHCLYETGSYADFVLSADLFLKNPNSTAEEIDTIHFELGESYFFLARECKNKEKKEELLWNAAESYEQVVQTNYGDLVLAPLTEIYSLLEEYPKAVSLSLLLSQKESEKKEEHLFRAAVLQSHCNRLSAIKMFGEIVEMNGAYAARAAFNQLNLLFQEKRFQDFIASYDRSFKHISADQKGLIRYFLGHSLFQTKDFAKAIGPLTEGLDSKHLEKAQEKNTLLALAVCAKMQKDLPLFEKVLPPLKKGFADEEETFHSILMYVEVCREKSEWTKAKKEIREVLSLFPRHSEREALLYDEAVLLTQEGKWGEAATAFEDFLAEFVKSGQRVSALRYLVLARQEDFKLASLESEKVKQQGLLEALEMALEEPKAFASVEKQKLRYQLGKLHYQLGQYDEAIEVLGEYLVDFGKDASCAEAYLLLAYSYLQGSQDEIQFVLNAERALAYNATIEGAADLRLNLFNIYLKLAQRAPSEEKAEMISKAADHLFFALEKPVSKENQKWLAAYYFRLYEKGQVGAAHRAAFVLEKLLNIDAYGPDKEGEAIKLASLYEKMGRFEQRADLLETLLSAYNDKEQLGWKYQRMAQFELGKTYLMLNRKQDALKAFDHLIETSSHLSSYFAVAAELERAKLKFSMLENPTDQELSEIYDALKDVQSRRKLHSEPLHLEAALSYVEFKTAFIDQENQWEYAQFHLNQMKENFTSAEDPLVKEYLSAASQFPDKESLFQQYLSYIDAEMTRLEGMKIRSAVLKTEAKEKFELLLADSTDATLTRRILKSMEGL